MRKEWKTCTSTAHQGNQRIVSRRESVARGFIDRRRRNRRSLLPNPAAPVDRSVVAADGVAAVADDLAFLFRVDTGDRLALSGRLRYKGKAFSC